MSSTIVSPRRLPPRGTSYDWEGVDSPPLPPLRTLVVDDEQLIREYVRNLLCSSGCLVTEAHDGDHALSLCHPGSWDVVVLDLMMPHRGGVDTLRGLRAIDPAVPVLLVSGYSPQGTVEAALEMPGTAFLQKPFGLRQLLSAVRGLVAPSAAQPVG